MISSPRMLLSSLLLTVISFACICGSAQDTQSSPQAAPTASPQVQVPEIDGGLGPCSVEVTVKRPGGKVVDGAKVTVHIAYGFLNVRRLDLEVPTNSDGKARITGLPNNLKHGLLLHAYKDNLTGTAFVDPAQKCQAKHDLVLVQQVPPAPDDTQSAPAGEKGTDKTSDKDTEKDKPADDKASPKKDTPQ